ncbi:hypothetical protein ILYODFUR_007443, partial [Ilyodon furcidens]
DWNQHRGLQVLQWVNNYTLRWFGSGGPCVSATDCWRWVLQPCRYRTWKDACRGTNK